MSQEISGQCSDEQRFQVIVSWWARRAHPNAALSRAASAVQVNPMASQLDLLRRPGRRRRSSDPPTCVLGNRRHRYLYPAVSKPKKNPNTGSGFDLNLLVTRAGFEPAISTLRGWLESPRRGSQGVATSSKWDCRRALRSPSGGVGRPGCYPRCYPFDPFVTGFGNQLGERNPLLWYRHGMRATIDKAGRLVIPRASRDQLGLRPGEVELIADGAALRVVPIHEDALVEADGRLVIPASGATIDAELVRALRDADRR